MNGAVAGLNQVEGVSHRFKSDPSVGAGTVPGGVAGAGSGDEGSGGATGAAPCAASALESEFKFVFEFEFESGHDGVASKLPSSIQNNFDADALCRGYPVLWIKARRMVKALLWVLGLASVRGGSAAG
jgi:hypothetical protein